jgi:ribosome maturation factor RimP
MASDTLYLLVERCVAPPGAHLIDVRVRGERGGKIVEVFVDSETGVTTGLCADLSREIASAIDLAGEMHGPYRLIVSSPGADRPLRFPWQYAKHVGRRLVLAVKTDAGRKDVAGTLRHADQYGIWIETAEDKTGARMLFNEILEGRVQLPW